MEHRPPRPRGRGRPARRGNGWERAKLDRLRPPPGLLVGVVNKIADAAGHVFQVRRRALSGRRDAGLGEIGLAVAARSVRRHVTHPVHDDERGRPAWEEAKAKPLSPAVSARGRRKASPAS